jgi:hypothetical protein
VGDVAERPQPLVRETIIVAVLFLFGQPYSLQGVGRLPGRHAERVVAVDLFYFGEGHPKSHGYLWALLLTTVGERALGLQANELLSIARWAGGDGKSAVTVVADGPRSSVIALAASAIETKAIGKVELITPLGSLKEIIETNRTFDQSPELFCFGLLERFDVKHLAAMVAPRPVVVRNASERAGKELAGLKDWYRLLGVEHDPNK